MKKALRETQKLRAGCGKAYAKISPHHRPLPGMWDGQNVISWIWSLPSPTNPVWWGSMHAISNYRGNRPTNTHAHRQDRLQYTAPLCLACTVMKTRSSADADNRLDAFSGQSRSTNMVSFHMLHIVSYCAIVTVFKTRRFYDIRLQKIPWPWNGGQRSLKVIESGIIR